MRWLVLLAAGCGFHGPSTTAPSDGAADTRLDDGRVIVPPTSPRRIDLDNSASATDLADFPVLVSLDAQRIDYAMVGNPATDLKFTDLANTPLPFEIERWDPLGESTVWVSFPNLRHNAQDSMLLSFGPTAQGTQNRTATWVNYGFVQHMAPGLASSEGTTHNGTATNVSFVVGPLGTFARFEGTGDEQLGFTNATALFDGWTSFTLELFLYPDYASLSAVSGEPRILDKGVSLDLGRVFVSGVKLLFQTDMHFTGGNDTYLNAAVPLRAWTYLAFTFDGLTARLYKDGALAISQPMTGGNQMMLAGSQAFYLGDPVAPLRGGIDELRIQRYPHSADWIHAQYLSMSGQMATFHDP